MSIPKEVIAHKAKQLEFLKKMNDKINANIMLLIQKIKERDGKSTRE